MSAVRWLLAEFGSADALEHARRTLAAGGCEISEEYGPQPRETDPGQAPLRPRSLPRAALAGGLVGGLGGLALQIWSAVYDYPIIVAGRPPASLIAFVPAAAELTLLGAACAIVGAFLRAARLPHYHDPLFDVPAFARASADRWFLRVPAQPDADGGRLAVLRATRPLAIHEVRDADA